jgi:purine-binding chemotaxis protein CheW
MADTKKQPKRDIGSEHCDMSGKAGKYLTFKLGAETYGFEIQKVHEIISMQAITRLPNTPAFMKGVINLRGKVIPVIDLRIKFGMPEKEVTDMTCIIVMQVTHEDSIITMGVIVDEVSEVLDIGAQEIEPPPTIGMIVDSDFILGMAKTETAVKILLDIDKVLAPHELGMIKTNSE